MLKADDFDYKRFREIADINGSYLMCDMAHISGFSRREMNGPFEYCEVIPLHIKH